jgi:hypothetical protein
MDRRIWTRCVHQDVQNETDVQFRLSTTSFSLSLYNHDLSYHSVHTPHSLPHLYDSNALTRRHRQLYPMAPTFTIFQDPPSASNTRASSTSLTPTPASVRSLGRLASSSTSVPALVADKENVDPSTGLPRTNPAKPKAKKALSSKNKENSSKASTKASKATRGGSTSPGPVKSAKTIRTSPYHPVSVCSLRVASITQRLLTIVISPCLCPNYRSIWLARRRLRLRA